MMDDSSWWKFKKVEDSEDSEKGAETVSLLYIVQRSVV